MKTATQEQLAVAKKFHIPVTQAWTINMAKVKAYLEYLETQEARDTQFLDENVKVL